MERSLFVKGLIVDISDSKINLPFHPVSLIFQRIALSYLFKSI